MAGRWRAQGAGWQHYFCFQALTFSPHSASAAASIQTAKNVHGALRSLAVGECTVGPMGMGTHSRTRSLGGHVPCAGTDTSMGIQGKNDGWRKGQCKKHRPSETHANN